MEQIEITKIVKIGNSYGLLIPQKICKGYKLQRGDHVVFGFGEPDILFIRKLSDDELRNLKPQPVIKF